MAIQFDYAFMLVEGYCCGLLFQTHYHHESKPLESVVEQGCSILCGCNGRVVPCQVQPVPYQDARQFQHDDHYDVHNVECLTVQIILETEIN